MVISCFFCCFFLKFYFIFKLYIIVLVLPNIKMNPPQVYICSPSWTLLLPPSPYHLSGLSQCTSPKHPVSCIEPGLATRFIHDILHVSMPFSQIFPPSPSLGLWYACHWGAWFCIIIITYYHVSMIIWFVLIASMRIISQPFRPLKTQSAFKTSINVLII